MSQINKQCDSNSSINYNIINSNLTNIILESKKDIEKLYSNYIKNVNWKN